MYTRLVKIECHPQYIQAFSTSLKENVTASRLEPGVISFEAYQEESTAIFWLIECFKSAEDRELHFKAPHFLIWQAQTAHMISEEIESVVLLPV